MFLYVFQMGWNHQPEMVVSGSRNRLFLNKWISSRFKISPGRYGASGGKFDGTRTGDADRQN